VVFGVFFAGGDNGGAVVGRAMSLLDQPKIKPAKGRIVRPLGSDSPSIHSNRKRVDAEPREKAVNLLSPKERAAIKKTNTEYWKIVYRIRQIEARIEAEQKKLLLAKKDLSAVEKKPRFILPQGE
jgi:hypothetical protein